MGASMKPRRNGNCISLESARFSRIANCVLELNFGNGQDKGALESLRTYVEADLLGRDRPVDLPRLYEALRGTAALNLLTDVVDDVSQQFVFSGKRVACLMLVLAARVQCEGSNIDPDQGRVVANLPPVRALERALRETLQCDKVSFDPRLYVPPLLGLASPRKIREHARGLAWGQSPEAPIALRPLMPQPQPDWRILCLLGAAVFSEPDWIDTRAPISIGSLELAEADLCLEEPFPMVKGARIQVECRAHGVHYFRQGVRFAEDVRRGLRIGLQHYDADIPA